MPIHVLNYGKLFMTRQEIHGISIVAPFTRQGDVKRVIDVGAGTGLLSMYAAGSSPAVDEVVAVEANIDMAKIATEIVAVNDDEDDIAGCVPYLAYLSHFD